MGLFGLGAWPTWASASPPQSMWTPPGQVGPTRGPPEPSRTFSVQYRKNPELFWNPKNNFLYMNLILRTIPDLLVMSWIQSETPNKLRSPSHIPYLLRTTSNLKCVTLRFANDADMIETPLRSITNSQRLYKEAGRSIYLSGQQSTTERNHWG